MVLHLGFFRAMEFFSRSFKIRSASFDFFAETNRFASIDGHLRFFRHLRRKFLVFSQGKPFSES